MGWQKRYYFWAIRIGLWGNKDATYWLKTMGLSFISPLFTMPISLVYDSYFPCLRFLSPVDWLWLISLYTFVVVLLNYFTPYLFLYWITLHAWKVLLKRFTQMFFLQSYSHMLTSANYPLGNNLFHPVLTLLLYSCPASVSESSFHCSCADVCYCKNQRCP